MRAKLNKYEVADLQRIYDDVFRLYLSFHSDENRDVQLTDSTVSEQLSCICASFETILQDY